MAFGWLDNNNSKSIDLCELLDFYGHLGFGSGASEEDKNKLKNLLVLCGYEDRAIRHDDDDNDDVY